MFSETEEVALAGMFRAAYKTCDSRVDPTLIGEAVKPYTLDKFESRADLCCRCESHIHFAYTLYKLHNTLAISRHRLGWVVPNRES